MSPKERQDAYAAINALSDDAERYRKLRSMYVGADFNYQAEGRQVLIFALPRANKEGYEPSVSASLDDTLDSFDDVLR